MNSSVGFPLRVSVAQASSLSALQTLFAEACNFLAPIVRENRCWNRVALHHLTYRELRQRFPQLGSQMACNAIYSVCRAARAVYQHPQSPWNVTKNPTAPLPLLRFLPRSPVYFDRHTLSLKQEQLSMFTLDGRMRFQLDISEEIHRRFRNERLREIVLMGDGQSFVLHFRFGRDDTECNALDELPEYLIIQPEPEKATASNAVPALSE